MERRLFALDQNFPLPIVAVLRDYMVEAELVAFEAIDPRLSVLDDWEVLLALHHHGRAWDGLITTDASMLRLPRELSVLLQTKLTLVVADAAGHDPMKATGLVLTHLPGICKRTRPNLAQAWVLRATQRPHDDPWSLLTRVAERQGVGADALYAEARLSREALRKDPLAAG